LSNPTINTIIVGLAEAIGADSGIAEWVADHYGDDATHHVHIGIDYDHPPVPQEDGPIIEIATGKRRRDLDARCQVHQVQLGTLVYSTGYTTGTDSNVHISTGVGWVNDLAVMVEHAAVKYFHDNHILWHTSDGLPDSSGGNTYRAVWTVDVSVRDVIVY
jgi:hypothetical protein